MKSITVLGALTALALTASVQANQDVSGFYIGGGVGSTTVDLDRTGYTSNEDTDGSTVKFIAGYQFNRIVAIEAQYTQYGEITPNKTLTYAGKTYKWDATTFSVSANLGYTFQNGLRPFGIIGLSSLDLGQSTKVLKDDDATAVHVGLGLEYTPAALSGVSFRVGYEADAFTIEEYSTANRYEDTDVMIGSAYVAASYKF
ncbi:porin family protein [Moritella sp. 5]|uniref:porin family protein n=1 Tax=Moritella sp. 5 TaxID=2746231 RepID=UPI001BABEDBE|nr:porin family protein [Moritella sp. 5]QUM80832.1 porin family protein [Moritella sp. 5]